MSEFSTMTMGQIAIEAIGKCCEVVVAEPNQLQFDLDSEEAYACCIDWLNGKLSPRFQQYLPPTEWASKSGNKHVVVTLPDAFSVPERIAMQTQGHSDPGREFAALCCHWDGSPHPILLFKPLPKLLTSGAESR
jgi:hypothetical protein